jgi:hypothetical protein
MPGIGLECHAESVVALRCTVMSNVRSFSELSVVSLPITPRSICLEDLRQGSLGANLRSRETRVITAISESKNADREGRYARGRLPTMPLTNETHVKPQSGHGNHSGTIEPAGKASQRRRHGRPAGRQCGSMRLNQAIFDILLVTCHMGCIQCHCATCYRG